MPNDFCPDRLNLAVQHMYAMHETLELPKNAAKGHWKDTSIVDLTEHLDQEVNEFKAALWGFLHHGQAFERVRSEGADISNIVSMIVDNCKRRETCNVQDAETAQQ